MKTLLLFATLAIAAAQTGSKAIFKNLDTADWKHEKDNDSVELRTDQATGATEMIVRFPGGHSIPPHWHDSNERILVLEGQLSVKQDTGETILNSGGYAFMPAKEIQKLSCSSATRCTFYLGWDGNPQSHAAK